MAEVVKTEVRRLGLTQHDVAAVIGKSQGAAWRRLSGVTPFSVDELERLAAHFGVALNALVATDAEDVA